MDTSINSKIVVAFDLASALCNPLNSGALVVDKETTDMVFGHADGLIAKHLYNIRDGRCSLQASIDFDPEEQEHRLDAEIAEMRRLVASIPSGSN